MPFVAEAVGGAVEILKNVASASLWFGVSVSPLQYN